MISQDMEEREYGYEGLQITSPYQRVRMQDMRTSKIPTTNNSADFSSFSFERGNRNLSENPSFSYGRQEE